MATVINNGILPKGGSSESSRSSRQGHRKPVFVLVGAQETDLGQHCFMHTRITLSSSGYLDGITRIWTNHETIGFRGTIAVILTDAQGDRLHTTEPRSYEVDPKLAFLKSSDRTISWSESLERSLLEQVQGYTILHTRLQLHDAA